MSATTQCDPAKGDLPAILEGTSMEEYLASSALSCSTLDLMMQSAHHFKNPPPHKPASHFSMGEVLHKIALEPAAFDEWFKTSVGLQPEGLKKNTKAGKLWVEENTDKDLEISHDEWERVQKMRAALVKYKPANELLELQGHTELSVYTRDCGTRVIKRARIDKDIAGSNVLVDIKSCRNASTEDFSRAIGQFGYHRKAAWYLDCANEAGMEEKEVFILIAVENVHPHCVSVYQIDADAIRQGREENSNNLRRMIHCEGVNRWPMYHTEMQEIGLPRYYNYTTTKFGMV